MLDNKNILITGGTGSFGKKCTEMILKSHKPNKLIIFSRDELKQFEMSQMFPHQKYKCIRYFLGDVRDKERLYRAFNGIDYVIHAAALKQVPAAESLSEREETGRETSSSSSRVVILVVAVAGAVVLLFVARKFLNI